MYLQMEGCSGKGQNEIRCEVKQLVPQSEEIGDAEKKCMYYLQRREMDNVGWFNIRLWGQDYEDSLVAGPSVLMLTLFGPRC